MKKLIARLVEERVRDLEQEVREIKRSRDWFEEIYGIAASDVKKLEAANRAEINRNRKREDILTEKLLEKATGAQISLPLRAVLPETGLEKTHERGLTDAERDTLWERAREYTAAQTADGVEITDEMIKSCYNEMIKDVDTWLSN